MPNERRSPAEPTLEELSAYLDHELEAATQARVAEHVAGCAGCKARLDGLRQAAYAIRALPMETPTRRFTVPEKRRPAFRWAPVGWASSGAVAALVIVFSVAQLNHGPGTATALTSGGTVEQHRAPEPAGQNQMLDSQAGSKAFSAVTNSVTVVDPLNRSRSMTLWTDAKAYPANGTMTVRVNLTGLPSGRTGFVVVMLERDGYAVRLSSGSGPTDAAGFQASYQFANLDLSAPVAASYTLIAVEQLPGGYGDYLVARLPVTITP